VVYFLQQSLFKRGIVTGSRLFLYSAISSAQTTNIKESRSLYRLRMRHCKG